MTHHDFDHREALDVLRDHSNLDLVREYVQYLHQVFFEVETPKIIRSERLECAMTREVQTALELQSFQLTAS
jgi:hypothetical protein